MSRLLPCYNKDYALKLLDTFPLSFFSSQNKYTMLIAIVIISFSKSYALNPQMTDYNNFEWVKQKSDENPSVI